MCVLWVLECVRCDKEFGRGQLALAVCVSASLSPPVICGPIADTHTTRPGWGEAVTGPITYAEGGGDCRGLREQGGRKKGRDPGESGGGDRKECYNPGKEEGDGPC